MQCNAINHSIHIIVQITARTLQQRTAARAGQTITLKLSTAERQVLEIRKCISGTKSNQNFGN